MSWLKSVLAAALFVAAFAAAAPADDPPSGGPAVPAGRPGRVSDKRPRHAGAIVLATVHDQLPPGDDHRHHDHTSHPAKPHADTEPDHTHGSVPGHWPLILLGLYCLAIIGASLVGGWLPQLMNLTHNRMQIFISLIGGFMLGIGVFHMLPHALVELGDRGPDLAAYGMMGGLVVMFLLLRVFHFHHHGPTEVACRHDHEAAEHAHPHGDVHDHDHDHAGSGTGDRSLSWLGIFLGMALHTLIDGLALGASVEADAIHGASGLLGIGTFFAVFLHKPLDSVSITSVMAAGGWSPASRALVNGAFSLICPLGAVLFMVGMGNLADQQSLVVGCALAVSAGVFLCIALSDLLPEMEFHSHSRLPLTAALLTGVALAWAIGFAESEHAHSHRHVKSHK